MKIVFFFFLTVVFGALHSQSIEHPTMSEVTIAYKAIPSGTTVVNGKPQIKVRPEAIVKLKPGDVKKIRFRVLSSGNLIAKAVYKLDSLPVVSLKGIKLFYSENGKYHLSIPDTLLLGKYTYEVETEDNNGSVSVKHSKSK